MPEYLYNCTPSTQNPGLCAECGDPLVLAPMEGGDEAALRWQETLARMRRSVDLLKFPAGDDFRWFVEQLEQDEDRPVLLVPDPEGWKPGWKDGDPFPFEVAPGWYSRQMLVELLRLRKNDPEAIQFIADILEE